MSDTYRIVIEDTFHITGRGLIVVGDSPGAAVSNGDCVRIELADGTAISTDKVFVEFHSAPGKVSLVLPGLTKDQVPVGSVLMGPT